VKINSAIQSSNTTKYINNEKSKEGTRDLLPNVQDNDQNEKTEHQIQVKKEKEKIKIPSPENTQDRRRWNLRPERGE
jgi:hypothetical protein